MNTRRKSIKVQLGTQLRLDELKAKGDACDGFITKPPVFFCRRYDMQNLETQCLETTITEGAKKMKTLSINAQLRVAAYVRVSTDEQAKERVSIDAQLKALRAWGRIQSWEIVREYRDEGFSGTNDNRPDYQQLLADARRGVFGLVVVAKLDRFMRNVRLFHQAIDELEKIGVGFVSIQEGVNTSEKSGTGRLFF